MKKKKGQTTSIKKQSATKNCFVILGLAMIVFISICGGLSIFGSLFGEDDNNKIISNKTETHEETTVDNSTVKELSLSENIQETVNNTIGKDGVTLEFKEENGIVSVAKDPQTYWDDDSIVRDSISDYIDLGKQAYNMDEVKEIKLTVMAEFTDKYGASSTEKAVELVMGKTEFLKYNWDKLGLVSYGQIYDSWVTIYIHPGIAKNIDFENLKILT